MNSNLFTLLMNLFEKSLAQLQANRQAKTGDTFLFLDKTEEVEPFGADVLGVPAADSPLRVFSVDEQRKLTKASYQFLMRMRLWQIITPSLFELVMMQLQLSPSPIVQLEETKWIARKVLATVLDEKQLVFLDLVLYPKENDITTH